MTLGGNTPLRLAILKQALLASLYERRHYRSRYALEKRQETLAMLQELGANQDEVRRTLKAP